MSSSDLNRAGENANPPTSDLVEVDAIFGRIATFTNDVAFNQIKKFGAHTRPELAFLLSVVDEGDAVFDIGGHIGTFAIPLAQRVGPRGRLLVVEASPPTFAVLHRNVTRSISDARAYISLQNALVAPPGKLYVLYENSTNVGASFFMPTSDDSAVAAHGTTLDALCAAHFTPRVVKIDIEGWEAHALSGAPLLLASRPIIYAEICDQHLQRNGSAPDELDRLFKDNGYRLFKNVGERNAAHDLFVVAELANLAEGGDFFDVLAVHRDDQRLARMATRAE
jgi:FkbM family methyltransferase